MNHHRFAEWGLGHMSHPEDPQRCCALPEDHRIHRPKYWREGESLDWEFPS